MPRRPLTRARESASILKRLTAKGRFAGCAVDFHEDPSMKLILTVLGVVLLVVAAVYFLLPADQLPGFFPGHETGVTRMHYKHGIVAGVVGVVLLALGGWMGRR
jgi:hypothetical protein